MVERYGVNDPVYTYDGPPKMIRNFLVALRLVEAGARVVSLNFSRWDWHGTAGLFNFKRAREDFPMLDQGLGGAAGRSARPRSRQGRRSRRSGVNSAGLRVINKLQSRDHWPRASFALMAGGGMNTGQVIGATDKDGGHPVERPVKFQEVFATLYHCIGIDPTRTTITDPTGRPHYLVDSGNRPIAELVG